MTPVSLLHFLQLQKHGQLSPEDVVEYGITKPWLAKDDAKKDAGPEKRREDLTERLRG